MNIPTSNVQDIDSIDKLETLGNHVLEDMNYISNLKITPKEEFFGHCSNIQAWAENGYDTRILHRNLAFPLLKELVNAGDIKAEKVFKEEIAFRIEHGTEQVIQFLIIEGYINYLEESELNSLSLECNKIENLLLNRNNLRKVPLFIYSSKSLKSLHLGENKISSLSELIGNLTSLRVLGLGFNSLTTLPRSIGKLALLENLYISSNKLINIPDSIGNLKSLQIFYLLHNQLFDLPNSIGNLKSLRVLDLRNNYLNSLPDSIGNLTYLEELYLGKNQLSSIPKSIRKLTSLKILYLSDNPLDISSIEDLTFLCRRGVKVTF